MSLDKLLYPRSLAIVGASDKVGPGFNAWNALKAVGYEGVTYFVNPKRDSLFGEPCYPSIRGLPGNIDAAFLAVPASHVLSIAAEAADKGAAGVAVMSSGFGEAGEDGKAAQQALVALARERGLAVCGPNCLGFLNFVGRTALFGTSVPDEIAIGGIAAIVQSGSVGIALLNSARGLGFSHLVTSGNEAVTTVADYMERLVSDRAVKLVVVFVEQLREPRRFLKTVRDARAMGKPVIVLKSGRSVRGQSAVMAHTGAVAGNIEVFEAALRQAGAIHVASLDELIETALVFSRLDGPLKADGAAMVSLSGGEIALALDAGEEAQITLPPVSSATGRIAALLPPHSHIANPLDLTWAGLYDPNVARQCTQALGEQDDVGLVVLLQDAPDGLGQQQAARYAALLDHVADGASAASVPLVALSNVSGALHPDYAAVARSKGIACLRGTREGMAAIARRLAWSRGLAAEELPPTSGAPDIEGARRALAALQPGIRVVDEFASRRILGHYGIPGVEEILANDATAAVAAAERIGFPVALKGLAGETAHKSELGLVRLDLRSGEEVADAADTLLRNAGRTAPDAKPRFLVQKMERPVGELLVGARIDPHFGPVIVVGGGGIHVELFRDVAIRLAPVGVETAMAMIGETRSGRILEGWRGKPSGDLAAAAAVVSAMSRFVSDFSEELREVEINPLAVLEEGYGCRALDCLIALGC